MQITSAAEFRKAFPDFVSFVCKVWEYLCLPQPTDLQRDLAENIEDGPKRGIFEAFRGVGKSWITVAFVCWVLGTNPDYAILVVSASKASADEFSTFCLQLIRGMDELLWLEPDKDKGNRDSKIMFDVAPARPKKAPSVKSLGITSQLTGSRADIIVLDDIEIPSNSLTPGMRAKLSEQVKECDAILKPDAYCRIIVLGTPQCEDSIYNKLQERGYQCMIWPARYPTVEEQKEHGSRIARFITERMLTLGDSIVGSPTDPVRFGDLDLRERELSYGRAGFALQFQLRTRLSDLERYPLKVRDLIVMDIDKEKAPEKPIWCSDEDHVLDIQNNLAMKGDFFHRPMELVGKWLDFNGIVMAIDPSGRGKDETGYAVVAMLNGFLYVLAVGGLPGGYDDSTLRALSEIACLYKVKHVIVEANFGDGMYTQLLKPVMARVWDVMIEEVKHSIQKEKRLCDTLEPVVQGHRLVLDTSLIDKDYESTKKYSLETAHQYSFIYQFSRLTREKGALAHDDRLDALAIAVAYWTEALAADADTEQRDHRARELDKELEKFMDSILGDKVDRTPIWSEYMR